MPRGGRRPGAGRPRTVGLPRLDGAESQEQLAVLAEAVEALHRKARRGDVGAIRFFVVGPPDPAGFCAKTGIQKNG